MAPPVLAFSTRSAASRAPGIVMSAYELPRTLGATLRSHPACHAAEGQMTRDALVSACESLGLRVLGALASR